MLEQRPWLHNLNQIAYGNPGAVHVSRKTRSTEW